MAKKTLLQLVQNILSSLDSDSVNSISDTVEALQVAAIVEVVYDEMTDGSNWPHLHKLSSLEGVSDTAKPTHMKMAVGVKEITRINYNKRKIGGSYDKYEKVQGLTPEAFLDKVNSRKSDKDNVITVTDFDDGSLFVFDDQAPEFWTTFDEEYIVFDSYDAEVDDTLQESKSQILGWFDPSPFTLDDDFVPDIPSEMFTSLLAEAKSTAAVELNQEANSKAEQVSRRSRAWIKQKSFKVGGGITYKTNYGRNIRKRSSGLLDLSSTSSD